MGLNKIFTIKEFEELRANSLRPTCTHVTEDDLREKGIIISGLGAHGRFIFNLLGQENIKPAWLVDNDKSLYGTKFHDVLIRGSESLIEAGSHYVLLASNYAPEMAKDCEKYNVKNWILPAALSSIIFTTGELGITFDELNSIPEVNLAFELLSDDKSREIYKDFIRYHTCFSQALFSKYEPNQYFCDDLIDRIDYSSFVDAGAYDGDSLQSWLKHVDSGYYYGFEPQIFEYNKLVDFVNNNKFNNNIKINTYNCGLGSESTSKNISLNGVSASFSQKTSSLHMPDDGENSIKIMKLDDIKLENKPTVIKCDVEGFELNVLKGSVNSITNKTTLIICVYHKKHDFFEIPIYIHNILPKANIYFRQHCKHFGETVCYAIS
jgi:FkbM family methyltransferase